MIAKTVYLFLAVLSMLSSTGLLRKLAISGVLWTGVDLILTLVAFLRFAHLLETAPWKLLLHMWLVELLGEHSKVVYLISTNSKGPAWDFTSPTYYELCKWLFRCTRYSDPFSGVPQRLELSTSIVVDESRVHGCLAELQPLKMRVRSCIIVLDEEAPGWCLILKSTNISKKWIFDRVTAQVLYQVLSLMNDETFIIEGDWTGEVLHCIELDKFVSRTIVETRSGLVAHRRVVVNDEMKAFV